VDEEDIVTEDSRSLTTVVVVLPDKAMNTSKCLPQLPTAAIASPIHTILGRTIIPHQLMHTPLHLRLQNR
jgi:hypothetical protein